jgi:beta-glucanase (GH16 family)
MLTNIKYSKAQIPVNDPAWNKQTSLSDEFKSNSSINNTGIWWNGGNRYANAWAAEVDTASNLSIYIIPSGGDTVLRIKADTLANSVLSAYSSWHTPVSASHVYYHYQSSAIMTDGPHARSYKYGYFEIYAKYPTSHYCDWPAFWLWSDSCGPPTWYNEIDICENGGDPSHNGHQVSTNWHVSPAQCTNNTPNNGINITVSPLLSAAYHKYAVEWNPHRVTYYFDDSPIRTLYDATGDSIPQHPMNVMLDFAIDPWHTKLNTSDWNYGGAGTYAYDTTGSTFPHYFDIDYFRYYTLTADCNNPATICAPSDYDRKVKNHITTNNTCSPNFNPSTAAGSYTLRATDYVLLDVPTGTNSITINPTGTGYFAIDILPCPQ